MSYNYIDIDELERDANYKGSRTPQEIAEDKFYNIYKGAWKSYLASIEWDTWCKPHSPKELAEIKKEIERKTHPFKKFM